MEPLWGSFWGDENVPRLIEVMGAQLCEYTGKPLNGRVAWCVDYASVKLLAKNREENTASKRHTVFLLNRRGLFLTLEL